MGDGRTNLFRNMWTRTTTNDKVLEEGMVDTTPFRLKNADQYPIGATLEEQARHTDWEEELKHMPNQKLHRNISFVKSGLRLVACIFGMTQMYVVAFALLFMAEVVGIYEEMV
jgi:hypothetical protein